MKFKLEIKYLKTSFYYIFQYSDWKYLLNIINKNKIVNIFILFGDYLIGLSKKDYYNNKHKFPKPLYSEFYKILGSPWSFILVIFYIICKYIW